MNFIFKPEDYDDINRGGEPSYTSGANAIKYKDVSSTGEYNKSDILDTATILRVMRSAIDNGVDPYVALGTTMRESNMGNFYNTKKGIRRSETIGGEVNPMNVNEIYYPAVKAVQHAFYGAGIPYHPQQAYIDRGMVLLKDAINKGATPEEVQRRYIRWTDWTGKRLPQDKRADLYTRAKIGVQQTHGMRNDPYISALYNSLIGRR